MLSNQYIFNSWLGRPCIQIILPDLTEHTTGKKKLLQPWAFVGMNIFASKATELSCN